MGIDLTFRAIEKPIVPATYEIGMWTSKDVLIELVRELSKRQGNEIYNFGEIALNIEEMKWLISEIENEINTKGEDRLILLKEMLVGFAEKFDVIVIRLS